MKRLLAMMLLMAFFEVHAYAAAEDVQVDGAGTDRGAVLVIDNSSLYPGMNRPYSGGYMPEVMDEAALIVLPLLACSAIENNALNVNVELGSPENSPFVFENLNRTVTLEEHIVNDGEAVQAAYLIDLSLPLTEDRKAGRYPVVLTVQGQTEEGDSFSQAFTVYVTIAGEAELPEATETPAQPEVPFVSSGEVADPAGSGDSSRAAAAETEPPPQPKMMITGFGVDPWPATAGQEFVLTVDMQNTNPQVPMRNVKITVSGETIDAVPAGEAGSFYFTRIEPEETVSISSHILVQPGIATDALKILVHVEYEGANRIPFASDESLSLLVRQPTRVEMDDVNIPVEVRAGDTLSVFVNVMNMGRGTAYNVRVTLDAPGLSPEGSLFLGNLESGTSKKGELYVFVDMLNTASDGKERYGETSGQIVLSYENALSELETQTVGFTTRIESPLLMQAEMTAEDAGEEQDRTAFTQWWISAATAGSVLAGLILFLHKRRKASEDDNAAA